jgi:hypothetical protein
MRRNAVSITTMAAPPTIVISCCRKKEIMIQVSVYCQPTTRNDRLSSLLSAVFQNPIRPDFTRAILEKPSQHENHRNRRRKSVGVILVGGTRKQQHQSFSLRRRICQFAVSYRLQTWTIPSHCDAIMDDDMLLVTLE